jgi:hypothetical protein
MPVGKRLLDAGGLGERPNRLAAKDGAHRLDGSRGQGGEVADGLALDFAALPEGAAAEVADVLLAVVGAADGGEVHWTILRHTPILYASC